MNQTLHLIPAEGRRVVDPATRKPLAGGGEHVPVSLVDSTYWMRRLAEGDVTLGPGALDELGQAAADSTPVQTTSKGTKK